MEAVDLPRVLVIVSSNATTERGSITPRIKASISSLSSSMEAATSTQVRLIWASLDKLKILHLEDFGIKFVPRAIGLLSELRYLGLRNNYIQALPHSLGCLKKLEVLDIAQNFMVEVPDIIWDMNNLLHLYMNEVICRKPLRIDALWSLVTLTYISVDKWICIVSSSEEATGLEKLGIEGVNENSDTHKLFKSLAKLKCLYHLVLKGFHFKRMPYLDNLGNLKIVHRLKVDGFLPRLPRSFPLNLDELKLVNTCLDQDPMPVLGKIRCLSHLKLQNAYTGEEMEVLEGEFPWLAQSSVHRRAVASRKSTSRERRDGEARELRNTSLSLSGDPTGRDGVDE